MAEPLYPHDWRRSVLGHGVGQCWRCLITFDEAMVLSTQNDCPGHPDRPKLQAEKDG